MHLLAMHNDMFLYIDIGLFIIYGDVEIQNIDIVIKLKIQYLIITIIKLFYNNNIKKNNI